MMDFLNGTQLKTNLKDREPSEDQQEFYTRRLYFSKMHVNNKLRNSDQYLIPLKKSGNPHGMYDLYPSLKLADGKIHEGIVGLAKQLVKEKHA